MHLYRHLPTEARRWSVEAASASSTFSASQSVAASTSSKTASIATTAKSVLVSPVSFTALHALKQGIMIERRKYVSNRSGDIVDLVICLASIIGALTIIIPYCINRRSRKLRHALILGLATSDLVSSLIITITTSYLIAGQDLTHSNKLCNFAGYIFSAAVWTQHLWNLSIAGITYMILVFPLSPFVSNVERHLVWLWPAFWAIALIVNGIAWHYVGFTNVDGYCTFDPKRGGPYFSAIFQFVPRGIVVVVILVLYTHLFFFLRRINLFSAAATGTGSRRQTSAAFTGSNNRTGQNGTQSLASSMAAAAAAGTSGSHATAFPTPSASPTARTANAEHQRHFSIGRRASQFLSSVRRTPSSSSASGMRPGSTTVVGETASHRNGSDSTQGKTSTPSSIGVATKLASMQMQDYVPAEISPKSKPSEVMTEDGPLQREQSRTKPIEQQQQQHDASWSLTTTLPFSASRPRTATTGPAAQLSVPRRPTTAPGSRSSGNLADDSSVNELLDVDDGPSAGGSVDDLVRPMAVRRDVRDFEMTSPPQEHLRHYSLSSTGVKIAKRVQAEQGDRTDDLDERRSPTDGGGGQGAAAAAAGGAEENVKFDNPNVTYEDTLGPGWTWGMAVDHDHAGSAGVGHGHLPTSSQTGVSSSRRRSSRWQFWSTSLTRREGISGTSSTGSSTEENGVESTGSTLNRQASVLLLLYPAVYVCLFSVSIIRIIVDLSTPADQIDPRRNSDALHAISRWTIFAQGAIDAVIFQLIERQFRRRMKRRRRIAAGETVEDSLLTKVWKWTKGMMHARSTVSEKEAIPTSRMAN